MTLVLSQLQYDHKPRIKITRCVLCVTLFSKELRLRVGQICSTHTDIRVYKILEVKHHLGE